MIERPILFSTRLMKANLEGRKSQTRRLMGLHTFNASVYRDALGTWSQVDGDGCDLEDQTLHQFWHDHSPVWTVKCPYGKPGDRLWVRETWAAEPQFDHLAPRDIPKSSKLYYNVSHVLGGTIVEGHHKARPSIHMPRWASRMTLEVTQVRVQRLQDITDEDAWAEGVEARGMTRFHGEARVLFAQLWDSVNGEKPGCAWKDNPTLSAISYKILN